MSKTNQMEAYNAQIKELFREFAGEALFDAWADYFDVEFEGGKTVTVCYHGTEKVKAFQKACKADLKAAVVSALGPGKKIKIKKRAHKVPDTKTRKNLRALKFFVIGMVFVCIATAILLVLGSYIQNRSFRETFYNASSIKLDGSMRVVQLSDLHNTEYGENNKRLLERVKALAPNIIICTGDMVNSATEDVSSATALCEELAKIAPAYYIYGNNEAESIYDVLLTEKELDEKFGFDDTNRDESALRALSDAFETSLEAVGMKVLKNECDTITVNNVKVDVYGVLNSNPSSFWSYSETAFLAYLNENPDHLKITAVHEPFIFEAFETEFWGDLMVCGHTHGGTARLPVLGPVYTHEGGLFPERSGNFVYGRYQVSGCPLIVSGGLENTNVFRINNRPELVVIDLNKF